MMAHQLAFNEQQPNLERVRSRIARSIVRFYTEHLYEDVPVFHMEELLGAVEAWIGRVAPDSPGRILRDLKQAGLINYEVVNRAQSLYRVLPLATVASSVGNSPAVSDATNAEGQGPALTSASNPAL